MPDGSGAGSEGSAVSARGVGAGRGGDRCLRLARRASPQRQRREGHDAEGPDEHPPPHEEASGREPGRPGGRPGAATSAGARTLNASTSRRTAPPGDLDEHDALQEYARRAFGQPSRRAQQVGLTPLSREPAPGGHRAPVSGLRADLHRPERQALDRPQERQAQRPRGRGVAGGRATGRRAPLQPRRLDAQPLALLARAGELPPRLVPLAPGGYGHAEVEAERGEQEEGGGPGGASPPAPRPGPPDDAPHLGLAGLRTGLEIANPGARASPSRRRSHDAASRATTCISKAPPRA